MRAKRWIIYVGAVGVLAVAPGPYVHAQANRPATCADVCEAVWEHCMIMPYIRGIHKNSECGHAKKCCLSFVCAVPGGSGPLCGLQ